MVVHHILRACPIAARLFCVEHYVWPTVGHRHGHLELDATGSVDSVQYDLGVAAVFAQSFRQQFMVSGHCRFGIQIPEGSPVAISQLQQIDCRFHILVGGANSIFGAGEQCSRCTYNVCLFEINFALSAPTHI